MPVVPAWNALSHWKNGSVGSPNQRMNSWTSSGVPRKNSTYAIATMRSGRMPDIRPSADSRPKRRPNAPASSVTAAVICVPSQRRPRTVGVNTVVDRS